MLKLKELLTEGILDGIKPSFIIDSGINEESVSSGKKSMSIPRYSVWGFKSTGNGTPKVMENSNDINKLIEKYNISEDDIYPIEGTMQETIRKVGKDKWAVYSKTGGKRLGTHDSKIGAENQLKAIEYNKHKNENTIIKKSING